MSTESDPDRDPSKESGPRMSLPPGTPLRAEYRVEAVLGAGSFGITYRARDEHLERRVAIKEYYPSQIAERVATDPAPTEGMDLTVHPHSAEEFEDGLQQFMEEGRTLARFDHPNVVDVDAYFEENGTGYLVMDYYEGQTLADYLGAQGGWLSEEEAIDILHEVLDGLGPVHAAGVLHRDIDPQNIYLVDADDAGPEQSYERALLIDFGAAREAVGQKRQRLDVILKHGYAPAEQYTSDGNQGPWTDVYACAATLYKCLTGLKPPRATDRLEEDKLVDVRQMRDEVSMETSLAVKKGLALRPEQRPASAREFAELLGRTRTVDDQTQTLTTDSTSPGRSNSEPDAEAWSAGAVVGGNPGGSSGNTAGSLMGVAAGIVASVGGTLLVSEARAVEVFSFFGTWVVVCVGLVRLFREGEQLMSSEARAAVSDWLLRENFVLRRANWPETFTALFDAVFTRRHLSWACFGRSALTSVGVVLVLLVGFIGFGLLDDFVPRSVGDTSAVLFLALPIAVNVGVDYVSLFETRWILGRMSETDSALAHVGYLGVDLLLTVLCFLVPVSVVEIVLTAPFGDAPVWTAAFWEEVVRTFGVLGEWLFRFHEDDARLLSVMFVSTLFTSVWVWAYVGTGMLLRGLHPVLWGLDGLKAYLDVEGHPLHAMGLLLAVVTSLAFAVSAPLVL